MPNRMNVSSGVVWEDVVGYSRAVRAGNLVEVSGTAAIDQSGEIVGLNDPYQQTVFILQKIEKALSEAGATMADVVRTRMYTTDITRWQEVGRAHGEYFKDIKPATTMVEVKSLVTPEMIVEIEVTAIIGDSS